jgi:IMP dehydrogenase
MLIIGGLRAGMGYCGSKDIPTLQETGRFVRITVESMRVILITLL